MKVCLAMCIIIIIGCCQSHFDSGKNGHDRTFFSNNSFKPIMPKDPNPSPLHSDCQQVPTHRTGYVVSEDLSLDELEATWAREGESNKQVCTCMNSWVHALIQILRVLHVNFWACHVSRSFEYPIIIILLVVTCWPFIIMSSLYSHLFNPSGNQGAKNEDPPHITWISHVTIPHFPLSLLGQSQRGSGGCVTAAALWTLPSTVSVGCVWGTGWQKMPLQRRPLRGPRGVEGWWRRYNNNHCNYVATFNLMPSSFSYVRTNSLLDIIS